MKYILLFLLISLSAFSFNEEDYGTVVEVDETTCDDNGLCFSVVETTDGSIKCRSTLGSLGMRVRLFRERGEVYCE